MNADAYLPGRDHSVARREHLRLVRASTRRNGVDVRAPVGSLVKFDPKWLLELHLVHLIRPRAFGTARAHSDRRESISAPDSSSA